MRVVLSWLNELAAVGDDVDALADALSMLGMTVEEIQPVGRAVDGVVTARVLDLRPHPQADRIQLVDVDTGDGEPLQICCGAFNMQVGDVVPLATLGTVMPNGLEIARRKLRGEWSNGMLCSGAELELGNDHSGILVLPPDLPLGVPAFEALGIRPDVVLDCDLPRNRPDAWCHLGVARDLAPRLGVPFTPALPELVTSRPERSVPVAIDAPDLCGRFTLAVLSGVVVGPSPRWMADRLTAAGMRPINNVVDVSNYVMLELGRPNHPYDLATLPASGIRVRRAAAGETMVTLDGVTRTFTPDDLLICDGDDRPIGIGGVMGGQDTEIAETTTEVALEIAWFAPEAIARTALRLGLRSEASARFERGVDWANTETAIARFAELLRETCPDVQVHAGITDARGTLPATPVVAVRTARVGALLGIEIGDDEVCRLLGGIGFTAEGQAVDGVQLFRVPTWRPDCTDEIDLVEEVARHFGYERIGKVVPTSTQPGALTEYQRRRRLVRDVLVGAGCSEAMPLPFLAPGDLERAGLPADGITLTNPLAAEESILRTSLLPGLLQAVAYNASHRNSGVRLFEVGHVYRRPVPGALLPDEREQLGAALAGADAFAAVAVWRELAGAVGVTSVVVEAAELPGLHPTRTARLVGPAGEDVGVVGEVDPDVLAAHGIDERVAWLEADLPVLLGLATDDAQYRPVSRFPSSDIDLAFVVADDVAAARVEATVAGASQLVWSVRLFDVYRGVGIQPGHRSLAYRVRLQPTDRTLTDADVAAARQACIDAAAAVGATLRA
jgi:phenylalanyl-tRNA synthetase beta chain